MNKYELLLKACENEDLKSVQELLTKKNFFTSIPDINRMVNGSTPLIASLNNNDDNIFKFLIEKGANVNIKDNNGFTALHKASIEGRTDIVEILVYNNANIYAECNSLTPLYYALKNRHVNIVNFFLKEKIDINKLVGNPTKTAIEEGLYELAEIFIGKTLNPNELEDAFIIALEKEQEKLTNLMKEKGVQLKKNINLEDACRDGQIKVVELLLNNGVDVNQTNALAIAASYGSQDIVRLLLEKGANVNGKKKEQKNFHPFINEKERAAYSSLLDFSDSISHPLPIKEALLFGQKETFMLLFEKGASIDFPFDARFLDSITRAKKVMNEVSLDNSNNIDELLNFIISKKKENSSQNDSNLTFKYPKVNLEFQCLNCKSVLSVKCQSVDSKKGVRCACESCGKIMNIPPTIYDFGKFWKEADGNALVENWINLITLE